MYDIYLTRYDSEAKIRGNARKGNIDISENGRWKSD